MIKINYFRKDKETPAGTTNVEETLKLGGLNAERPMQIRQGRNMPIWLKVLISLLPAMFFLVFFTFYPMINTAIIAFIEDFAFMKGKGSFAFSTFFEQLRQSKLEPFYEPLTGEFFNPPATPRFSFKSFRMVLTDRIFQQALLNTAILTGVSVPLTIIIALLLSVALNSIKPLKGFFQTVFFLPYVTNSIAIGMVFNVLFSPEPGGIMNQILQAFGGKPTVWIDYAGALVRSQSKFNMGVVLVTQSIWSGMAFKILVFMSGLATIDKQYYDAAKVDGTKRGRIFRKITVPLLSPQIFYITVTSFIGAFKMYSSVISVVGSGATNFGGSDGKLWITVVGYIYLYRSDDLPRAAAGAFILLIIVLLITLVQMQISKRKVHY
jgi:multiple sugar transport system permease protein